MTYQPSHCDRRRVRDLTLQRMLLVGLAASSAACSSDDPGIGTVRSAIEIPAEQERVVFGDHGRLSGGMEGYAWVAAGDLATVDAPNPCNEHGCFTNTQGGLCTKGRLPALSCASADSWDCNYSANWGVMVGLNPKLSREAWGPEAPQTVALTYGGGSGSYRLVAHVAGDPDGKVYCIEGYVSGLSVSAGRLKSECWSSDGDSLPSFSVVDRIGLMLPSAKSDLSFNYCVSDVTLNAPADAGRVLISNYGKLSGPLDGYAWVAAGDAVTITSPSPCDQSGCFRNTGGKLCAKGSIPALECTGHGTVEYQCDWSTNWGAMIGVNPTAAHTAWGERAAERVSFVYSGGPGTYQLTAHVAGDPHEKAYCIRNYRSGQEVTAAMLRTKCWNESGVALSSFAEVDSFGLLINSAETPVDFDYCISAITAR